MRRYAVSVGARRVALVACTLCVVVRTSVAQHASSSPVMDALRARLSGAQRNLVGAAETMPADKYGYKATPAQMSFGEMVLHVARANDFVCAAIGSTKAPERPKLEATAAKDSLVARLKQSFDFCATVLASVDDSKLGDLVPFFGSRQVSRATAVLELPADWGDHYAAQAMYLRLNGLLPPTAHPRGAQ